MADAIERLYKLTVDGTAAVRELQKIAKSTSAVEAQFASAARTVKSFGVALAAAAGIAGIKDLADRVLSTSEAFDQLGKDALKLGVAVEELQRLRYAADLSGVSADQMDKAVAALAVGMQKLGSATDETGRILKSLGVTSGDSPSAALQKIADHFASMPNGVAKLSDAIAIFGKKIGPDLLPWLNEGGTAFRKLADQADRFGGVVSGKATAAAEAFNDDLARVQRTIGGMGRALVVGMLPALQAIAKTMTQARNNTDAYRETGVLLGEGLISLSKGFLYTSQAARTLGASLVFIQRIKLTPSSGIAAAKDLAQSIKDINRQTDDTIGRLMRNWHEAQREMRKPAPKVDDKAIDVAGLQAQLDAIDQGKKAAEKAANDLHDAWEPVRKLEEDIRKETADWADANRMLTESMAVVTASAGNITDANLEQARANTRVTASIDAQIKANQDAELEMQAMLKLAREGTDEQKKLAGAWLQHELAIKHMAPVVDAWKDVQDVMGAGFDRFVDSVSSGSVTAAQAFKGMVQSIVADLLKLLAQKYILQMFGLGGAAGGEAPGPGPGPGSGVPTALGHAFGAGQVLPFARGGVVSQRVALPMALMGEAGPEAVLPLRRGASGNLGVESAGATSVNVAIHNHTDAAVSARRNGAGDLEVIIEQTRKAIAADFRRGGTDVARAAEAAYRLSRGAAAPF